MRNRHTQEIPRQLSPNSDPDLQKLLHSKGSFALHCWRHPGVHIPRATEPRRVQSLHALPGALRPIPPCPTSLLEPTAAPSGSSPACGVRLTPCAYRRDVLESIAICSHRSKPCFPIQSRRVGRAMHLAVSRDGGEPQPKHIAIIAPWSPPSTARRGHVQGCQRCVIAERHFWSPPIQLGANRQNHDHPLGLGVRKVRKLVGESSPEIASETGPLPL